MQKKLWSFFFSSLFTCHINAQPAAIKKTSSTGEKSISVSAAVHIPLGKFSSTHVTGIAIDCSPGRHWFALFNPKKIAFTYNGGVAYYFGKKEIVSAYSYDYPAYFFIHAFGGILYNPVKNGSIILSAGPAVGIYNGNSRFNIGSKLELSYSINNKVAIGPGIILMKEPGADPLWSAAIKASFRL